MHNELTKAAPHERFLRNDLAIRWKNGEMSVSRFPTPNDTVMMRFLIRIVVLVGNKRLTFHGSESHPIAYKEFQRLEFKDMLPRKELDRCDYYIADPLLDVELH